MSACQEYDLLESELCLKADVLCDCDEEDLQRVQAKLSVINRELREVREILIKRLSRSNSSCESSCCDSEVISRNPITLSGASSSMCWLAHDVQAVRAAVVTVR